MLCVKCNKEVNDGFSFCPYCGETLTVQTAPENNNDYRDLFPESEPKETPVSVNQVKKPAAQQNSSLSYVDQLKLNAENGDIDSCVLLGDYYCNLQVPGVSAKESYELSAQYYIKALNNGCTKPDIYLCIGDVYLFKVGNRHKAALWYKRGAEAGVIECYGRVFTANTLPLANDGDAGIVNYDPITTWQYTTKYYELDPVNAAPNVAMCLINGWGTPPDLNAAETYLAFAEQSGCDPRVTEIVRNLLETAKEEERQSMQWNVSVGSLFNGVKNVVEGGKNAVKDEVKIHTGYLFRKWR